MYIDNATDTSYRQEVHTSYEVANGENAKPPIGRGGEENTGKLISLFPATEEPGTSKGELSPPNPAYIQVWHAVTTLLGDKDTFDRVEVTKYEVLDALPQYGETTVRRALDWYVKQEALEVIKGAGRRASRFHWPLSPTGETLPVTQPVSDSDEVTLGVVLQRFEERVVQHSSKVAELELELKEARRRLAETESAKRVFIEMFPDCT